MSEYTQYIGTPWEAGSQGPNSFDCMAFFRHVQRRHFGIEVPQIIAPDYDDRAQLANLLASHEERSRWVKIPKAEHGCAVIVHRPMHIGVWLDIGGGGVLHCVRGAGVVLTSDSSWPFSGFGRREFYRFGG